MVKPWWLRPPAFVAAMILVGVWTFGVFALEWYFNQLVSKWVTLIF